MNGTETHLYRFRSFQLDVAGRRLLHDGNTIALAPKAFDLLTLLIENNGRVVEKNEILETIWAGAFVEETNITRTIHTLRKLLGEDGNGNKFIETVPTKGYRFAVNVEEIPDTTVIDPAASLNGSPEIDKAKLTAQARSGYRKPMIIAVACIIVGLTSLILLLPNSFRSTAFSEFGGTKRPATNEEAHRLYLQGRALTDKHNRKDAEKAVEYLEQAVKIDPNYAVAYAQLAQAYGVASLFGGDKLNYRLKQNSAIDKALAIDEDQPEAHALLGEIKLAFEWDFEGAEKSFIKAIELDPDSMIAHRLYAVYLSSMGRHEEAVVEAKIAVNLEPTSILNHKNLGQFLYYARRYDEAIVELVRTIEIDPTYRTAYGWLVNSYKQKGENDKAFEYFLRSPHRKDDGPEKIELWKAIYARSGWLGITQKQLDDALEEERNGEDRSWIMPRLYAELGDNEKALDRLEIAFKENQRGWGWTVLKIDPLFDPLHSNPRFQAITLAIGLK